MDELKPCPFCGSSAVLREEYDYGYEGHNCSYHVECSFCLVEFPRFSDINVAIEAWNRRTEQ